METTELIERYLEGSLSEVESLEVEKRAQSDPNFRKLIELHREVNESISDEAIHDLHLKIRRILDDYKDHAPKRVNRTYTFFKIAAVFVLIAGVAVVIRFVLSRSVEERLYFRFYQAYETDIVTRSGEAAESFTRAISLYNNKNYNEAFLILSRLTSREPDNYQAWFFMGLTSIELNNFEQAIESLSKIPDRWDNPFGEHAKWYYALALLHERKKRTC
jgi:tetratricopeptide (TPR) repeat protein